jgi:FkbM family methyltransferase
MKVTIGDLEHSRFVNDVLVNEEYSFLFRELVILDIGCNIGSFSLWAHPLASQIYAIDIAKENIDIFNETISDNEITNIKTYNLGISGKSEIRTITAGGKATDGGWRLGEGEFTIQTYSVRDFLDREGIDYVDLLKIDTEGGEVEIFNDEFFPKKRVGIIIGELHLGLEKDAPNKVKSRLIELGYRYKDFSGNHFVAKL